MNVRKYTATTMDAALGKIKSELGRDAVILHTRCYRTGGFLGLGGRDLVEVTASNDVNVPARVRAAAPRPVERAYKPAAASDDLAAIKGEIAGVRALIEDLTRHTRPSRTAHWPEPLKAWYAHLTKSGVGEANALDVLEPVLARLAGNRNPDSATVARLVAVRLAESVRTAPPIIPGRPGAPAVVAFVGPTGVGKTTTIAKLAAHFTLRHKESVGLITLDTYRIAAVEQLRTYARIIDVPLEVVLSGDELPKAVERLKACSLILVDTAGRSQRDRMKMNDLKAFFEKRRPDSVHLVLSATSEREGLADAAEKFAMYDPDRILLTKLDELPAYGKLLDLAMLAPQPVSYLTTGQDVPDDIETARPERIAALVAGEVGLDG